MSPIAAIPLAFPLLGDAVHSRPPPGQQQGVLLGFFLIAAVLVGLWAIRQVAMLGRRGAAVNSPRRLFRSLCRAHRLSWSQRWLLGRIARANRLAQPAQLFVEPEYFDEPRLGPEFGPKAQRLRQLRDRLFAGLPGVQGPAIRRPAASPGRPRHPSAETSPPPLPPPTPRPTLDIPPWPDSSPASPVR
ncbi:MAG: hypothetical protein ABSG86_05000 [Thermoguttaceae bacterium]|jgi:hypothetical protein